MMTRDAVTFSISFGGRYYALYTSLNLCGVALDISTIQMASPLNPAPAL